MAGRQRRVRGEGSVYQRHDHPSCPALVDGERPDHSCRGTWVAQVDLGWVGGRRLRPTVTAKTRAELSRKLTAKRRELDAGVLPDAITVEKWLNHWLDTIASQRVRERTLQGYRGYVKTWLVPHLGRHRLDRLKPDHVRALYRAMEDAGCSDATRRQAHAILRRALVVAERDGRIMRNPAAVVDPPPVGKAHHDYHSAAEARTVIRAAHDTGDLQLTTRILFAYLTAMRQGEVLGLDWADVDLEAGVAHVHRGLTRITGKGLTVGKVKSEASERFVPLVGVLVEALRELRRVTGGEGFVFGGAKPTAPRRDYEQWRDALRLAGVKAVPLHGARASCASLLREMGVSERIIADILGHAQVATTQAHYIRSDDRQRRDALEKAERFLLDPPGV